MKFFNIDQHVSVISDVAHIFNNLGHQVDDWTLSGHHWVMNKPKPDIWLSDGTKLTCSGVSTQEVCDRFYEANKDKLSQYDGFIACYPVEFAMLYERWNKPIIAVNCVRYDHPNTFTPHIRNRLNDFLKIKHAEGKLYYVCNNKGDQFYTHYFTGIWGMHIPSLCEYTNAKYTGTQNRYVLHDRSPNIGIPGDLFIGLGALRNHTWRYTWQELYAQKGIIHVPYHNGSMSIFEHYTANVPMFFPSKQYAKELFRNGQMLSDLTFYKIQNMPEPEEMDNPNSLRNPAILDKWLDTCDFYDTDNMKYIQYFDSASHLEHLLRTVNTQEISQRMAEHNVMRRASIYNSWQEILTSIEKSK
jgi:hypothetical protein